MPVVNGDMVNRAAPEIYQASVNIFNIPMFPAVLVIPTDNVIIVHRYADIDDYESLARYLSIVGGSSVAVVDTHLTREKAKRL